MSQICVNGEVTAYDPGSTIADIVGLLTGTADGCAVAVNDCVVPRSAWLTRALQPGDRVEVLTAVQGG